MKIKNIFNLFTLLVCIFVSFTSCNLDNIASSAENLTATAIDEAQAASINDEIVTTADHYTSNSFFTGLKVKSQNVSDDDTTTIVTIDSIKNPRVLTISFGSTGVKGKRGNTLKGKIKVAITAKPYNLGAKRTITFVDFYVNNNRVKGNKTTIYNGNESWSISANDTILTTDNKTIIWKTDRTRKRVEGSATPTVFIDDKYEITGNSSGVNKNGKEFTMVIDNNKPLVLDGAYPYFVSGAITITSEKNTILVDYGSGTKDAKATATVNGVSKEFSLR